MKKQKAIHGNKIIVILGPTSSGKSEMAVQLAKKWNGEVVSADSRQVYCGLDIGTGKVTKREMAGVPHHLLDVAKPKHTFSVVEYKKLAEKAVDDILKRDKVPIIAGGTGFYIQAIVDNIIFPEVPPNEKLREELSKKTIDELFKILKKLDPRRAKEIDSKNPHRLIRAIEIATSIGKVPIQIGQPGRLSKYEVLQIGIKTDDERLKKKIYNRLIARLRAGMVAEVKKLHERGLTWKRMEALGLEYRYLSRYLRGKITKNEMIEQLNTAIWHYARRQKIWFKRDERIKWFTFAETKKIEKEIKKFLK
jgi:tRNA dimethylallyltransferase